MLKTCLKHLEYHVTYQYHAIEKNLLMWNDIDIRKEEMPYQIYDKIDKGGSCVLYPFEQFRSTLGIYLRTVFKNFDVMKVTRDFKVRESHLGTF